MHVPGGQMDRSWTAVDVPARPRVVAAPLKPASDRRGYRRLEMTAVAITSERATSAPTAASQLKPTVLRT
jgi:hypothetical protein